LLLRGGATPVAALELHRKVLRKNLDPTRKLIQTIDKTIEHLKQFWTPTRESYLGHGLLIVDSDLRKAYETYDPRVLDFAAAAMKVFAETKLE
jgi:hypothetical protein